MKTLCGSSRLLVDLKEMEAACPDILEVLITSVGEFFRVTAEIQKHNSMINKAIIIDPWHEISNNLVCATSKGSDQPAHTRRLIRAFAGRFNIL